MTTHEPARARLVVRVSGVVVGELSRDRHGGIRFVPEASWLGRDQHPRLGLRFLSEPHLVARGRAPSWFENLLPEEDSFFRQWVSRKLRIARTDSMALLAALGRDLPGAVEISPDSPEAARPDREVEPTEVLGPEHRFSLAGVQLKFSMVRRDDRFTWPLADETGDWILKIPGDRFPELVEVEHATMSWARASGLEVPPFRKVPVELISRVDRLRLALAEHWSRVPLLRDTGPLV